MAKPTKIRFQTGRPARGFHAIETDTCLTRRFGRVTFKKINSRFVQNVKMAKDDKKGTRNCSSAVFLTGQNALNTIVFDRSDVPRSGKLVVRTRNGYLPGAGANLRP